MQAGRNYLNRRGWAIDQKRKALAALPPVDYDAERTQKLRQLRELAASLEAKPHMADVFEAVMARIADLEASAARAAAHGRQARPG